MAKRVLGNDPFANGKDNEAAANAGGAGARKSGRPTAPPVPANKSRGAAEPAKGSSGAKARVSTKSIPPVATKSAPPVASKGVSGSRPGSAKKAPPVKPAATTPRPPKADSPPSETEVATTQEAPVAERMHDERVPDSAQPQMPEAEVAQSSVDDIDDVDDVDDVDFVDDTDEEDSIASIDMPPDLQRASTGMSSEPPPAPRPANVGEVKEDIRTIEAEIDRLLGEVSERGAGRETLDRVAARLRERIGGEEPAPRPSEPPGPNDPSVFDVARELLSSDYYRRQWGRVAMRDRAEEVDDFGLDPKYAARLRPFFDFLYERWWRIETHDIERVPVEGRVILCANHSGALPYDGAMLATALRREHAGHRNLRWLAEDFIFHFPFLGVFMNRIGAVRACQENAERLLRQDACVGVFPEGVKGISKPYRERYRLQRFGRGGHVKLAIRTRTPIVPVAILGAEEAHPLIAPTSILAKALGVPFVPVTPTFPWLGPLGLIPLPSKWKIYFLDPIPMDGYAPEAADDEVLVGRLNEKIRGLIQEELDRAVRARQSVLKG